MNNEKLRVRLEKLHLALLQWVPGEDSLRKRSDDLAAKIRAALDEPDLGGFKDSLSDIFKTEIIAFDDAHPRIAQLMREAAEILSSIGI